MAQDTFFEKRSPINCRGNLLFLDEPIVMGILNVTPDSFFDGGKFNSFDTALKRAKIILNEGGKVIDIGGYSSRPGAYNINEREEINRVIPIIEMIVKTFPETVISIDTFRSEVVKQAIDAGASIINDISGGDADIKMLETIVNLQVPYIMMHMQGSPQNMQTNPQYVDVASEVLTYFSKKVNQLTQIGVNDIILDPGFGFGKTIEHNYEILDRFEEFNILNLPLLAGISRKSMIYKKLGITPEKSLPETIRLNKIALDKGANILRVHDVKEAVELIENY
ncbi:MAG: dihydropteroate synthase [Flavobacteriales bacterium]|nr:dihydropteroate synthase [Flavobacteriales bacterium]